MNAKLYFKLSLLLLMGLCQQSMAQEGEVILASEHMKEAEMQANRALLRSRFKFADSISQQTLFFVAYRPTIRTYRNVHRDPLRPFAPVDANGMGHVFLLGFESFIGNWPLTLRVENATQLNTIPNQTYDYGSVHFLFSRRPGFQQLTAAEHYANLSTIDIAFRYYFNLKERMRFDVSGRNAYHRYLYFQIKDLVSYSRKVDQFYDITTAALVTRRLEKGIFINPHYVSVGFGQQKRVFNSMFVDVRLGLSYAPDRRVMKLEAHDGILVDAALSFGLGLGKRN